MLALVLFALALIALVLVLLALVLVALVSMLLAPVWLALVLRALLVLALVSLARTLSALRWTAALSCRPRHNSLIIRIILSWTVTVVSPVSNMECQAAACNH